MLLRETCSTWWEPPANAHLVPSLPHPKVLALQLITLSFVPSSGLCSKTAALVPSMLAAGWPCSGKASSRVPTETQFSLFLLPHIPVNHSLGPLPRRSISRWIQSVWVWTLALPFARSVILGKLHNLSVLQSLYLQSSGNSSTFLLGLLIIPHNAWPIGNTQWDLIVLASVVSLPTTSPESLTLSLPQLLSTLLGTNSGHWSSAVYSLKRDRDLPRGCSVEPKGEKNQVLFLGYIAILKALNRPEPTEMACFLLSACSHLVSSEVSGLRILSLHVTTLWPLLGILHPASAGHPAREVGPLLTWLHEKRFLECCRPNPS